MPPAREVVALAIVLASITAGVASSSEFPVDRWSAAWVETATTRVDDFSDGVLPTAPTYFITCGTLVAGDEAAGRLLLRRPGPAPCNNLQSVPFNTLLPGAMQVTARFDFRIPRTNPLSPVANEFYGIGVANLALTDRIGFSVVRLTDDTLGDRIFFVIRDEHFPAAPSLVQSGYSLYDPSTFDSIVDQVELRLTLTRQGSQLVPTGTVTLFGPCCPGSFTFSLASPSSYDRPDLEPLDRGALSAAEPHGAALVALFSSPSPLSPENCLDEIDNDADGDVDFDDAECVRTLYESTVSLHTAGECIQANFTPGLGLKPAQAAEKLGYDHFNWLQVITLDNALRLGPLFNQNIKDRDGNFPSVPFFDPVAGGYQYQADTCGVPLPVRDDFPWYWDEVYSYDCRPASPGPIAVLPEVLGVSGTEATFFEDCPSSPANVEFLTGLVGVRADGTGDLIESTLFRWQYDGGLDELFFFSDLSSKEFTDFTSAELDLIQSIPIIRGNRDRSLLTGTGSTKPGATAVNIFDDVLLQTLGANGITLRVSDGYILGDVDDDRDVDRRDLDGILSRIDTDAVQNDAADVDRDGLISAFDVRKVALLCTRPLCATEPMLSCGLGYEVAAMLPILHLVTRRRRSMR